MSSFKDFKDFEVGDSVQIVMEYYSYEGIIKGEVNGYYVVESDLYGIQQLDGEMLRHVLPVDMTSSKFSPTDKMKYLLDEIYKVNLINEDEYKLGLKNGNICSMFISLYVDKMYAKRKTSTPHKSRKGHTLFAPFSYYPSSSHSTYSKHEEDKEDEDNSSYSFSIAGDDDDYDDCAPGLFGDMWSKSSRSSFSYAGEDEDDDLRPGCGW